MARSVPRACEAPVGVAGASAALYWPVWVVIKQWTDTPTENRTYERILNRGTHVTRQKITLGGSTGPGTVQRGHLRAKCFFSLPPPPTALWWIANRFRQTRMTFVILLIYVRNWNTDLIKSYLLLDVRLDWLGTDVAVFFFWSTFLRRNVLGES